MSDREKLIELIDRVLQCLPWGEISTHTAKDIADHLISNGVTVQGNNTAVRAIPLDEIYRVIAGHSNYHGDGILSALTCIAEGKEVKPVRPLATDNNVGEKWIPVSERLPDGECLAVSMLNGPAYQEMLIGYVGEASNWGTGYACESDGEILPNVTHWMPLPEPPKECE